jgi:hypothetical protein
MQALNLFTLIRHVFDLTPFVTPNIL